MKPALCGDRFAKLSMGNMDDRAAHFLTLVGRVCESAQLADLPVALVLADGERLEGQPRPIAANGDGEVDDTGYGQTVLIGDRQVRLADVVEVHLARGGPD
jgi:hypothetical protein